MSRFQSFKKTLQAVLPLKSGPGSRYSIRTRTILMIAGVFLVLAIILILISQAMVAGGFEKLESETTAKNVDRAMYAVDEEVTRLHTIGAAVAESGEIKKALSQESPASGIGIFPDELFVGSNLNIIILADENGDIIYHKFVNLEYNHEMPTPKSLLVQLGDEKDIFLQGRSADQRDGILRLNSGPMIVAIEPVNVGEIRKGYLVVGRYIDAREIELLSQRTQLAITLSEINPALEEGDRSGILQELMAGSSVVSRADGETVEGYALLRDISGDPAFLAAVTMDRGIMQEGRNVIFYTLGSLIAILIISAALMIVVLEKTVLSRLSRLNARLIRIGKSGDLSSRVAVTGNDEIASVAGAVNTMLGALQTSQERLARSEIRYSRLFMEANDIICTLDTVGRFTSVNLRMSRVTGYTPETLCTLRVHDLATGRGREVLDAIPPRSKESPDTGRITYELEIKDNSGNVKILDVNSSIVENEAGVPGIFWIARDITDRKKMDLELSLYRTQLEELVEERTSELASVNEELYWEIEERKGAEKAIAEEKERLDITISSMAEGMISIDAGGTITLCNHAAAALIGREEADLTGKVFSDAVTLCDRDTKKRVLYSLSDLVQGEDSLLAGTALGLNNERGSLIPVSLSTAPIRTAGGEISGWVVIIRDVTMEVRREEEILKVTKLESLGVLAGGIAHDFNNILLAVNANISLARGQLEDDSPLLTTLEKIERAVVKAREITRQLITFSKGGAPLKESRDIAEIIKDNVDFVMKGKKSRVVFHIDDDLWPSEVDEGQISQVLQNILINADQAMPSGGIIEITACNEHTDTPAHSLPPGNYLAITIKDQGTGIPEENLARIFDPYFTTKKSGSGLGLASSLSIMRKHSGTITVESSVGRGTAFTLFLPATNKPPVKREKIPENIRGTGKILVLDDDEEIITTIPPLLAARGFEVQVARDGAEAAARYRVARIMQDPFDAVILDLTIPGGMGGEEALALMREEDPDVVAIASSGYSGGPTMARFRERGFADILPKPYRIEEMVYKLVQLTGKKGKNTG